LIEDVATDNQSPTGARLGATALGGQSAAFPAPQLGSAVARCRLALRVGKGLAGRSTPRLQLRLGDICQGALYLFQQHIPTINHLFQTGSCFMVFFL